MSTEVDEKVWNAWILKGKLKEKAAAKKAKILGAILMIAVVLGTAIYRLAMV